MISLKNGVLRITSDSEDVARLVYEICFVVNIVTIFALYDVMAVATITGFLLLAAALFIWVGRKKSKVIIPYNTAWYTAVIVYAGLSSLWTSYTNVNFLMHLVRLAVILAIITSVAIYVDGPEDLERLMSLFVFSMLIIAALELSSVSPDQWFSGALGSNFSGCNANEIAFWMACAEMIAFYKFYIKKQRGYAILAVFFLAFVLFSSSRKASAAGLVVPLAVIIFSTYKKNYLLKVLLMLSTIAFILYLIMTNEVLYNALGQRFNSLIKFYSTGSRGADNSMYLRKYYAELAKEMLKESPIFGKGLNNFVMIVYYEYGLMAVYSHNNYWQLLSELGIAGFLIYYSFYVFCIIKLAKDIFINKSRISILFLSIMLMIVFIEGGLVSFDSKAVQLIISFAYASTYVGEDDGRKYTYIENNLNVMEE